MYKPPKRGFPKGALSDIAARCGVSVSYLYGTLCGKWAISPEQSIRLADATRHVVPEIPIGDYDWYSLGEETGCCLFEKYANRRDTPARRKRHAHSDPV